ncbi:MAG TPA: hypothetical protein VH054_19550 [Polyangiaceae bacterium]|jgi:hypothetical protein|nr:hypothetical protein [Polyangiaceae bacterium]
MSFTMSSERGALGHLEDDPLGDAAERRRALVEFRVEEISRVKIHEQESVRWRVRECLRGERTHSAAEVRHALQFLRGIEDGSRVRERRLLGAHQRLVAEERAAAARHDGLKGHPHRLERTIERAIEVGAIVCGDLRFMEKLSRLALHRGHAVQT